MFFITIDLSRFSKDDHQLKHKTLTSTHQLLTNLPNDTSSETTTSCSPGTCRRVSARRCATWATASSPPTSSSCRGREAPWGSTGTWCCWPPPTGSSTCWAPEEGRRGRWRRTRAPCWWEGGGTTGRVCSPVRGPSSTEGAGL